MFVIVKNSPFVLNYFVVEKTLGSVLYKYTENIEEATKFNSEELAISELKKSGFNAHVGIEVIPAE